MKTIKKMLVSLLTLTALVGTPVWLAQPAMAYVAPVDQMASAKSQVKQGINKASPKGGRQSLPETVRSITNMLLFIVGLVCVIMIIIGGLRYATSNGDASNTKAAKDTVLYAIVGLIVAIMAYAIANFVVTQL